MTAPLDRLGVRSDALRTADLCVTVIVWFSWAASVSIPGRLNGLCLRWLSSVSRLAVDRMEPALKDLSVVTGCFRPDALMVR